MNIVGLEYNLPQKALEIYLSGCNPPHCENCHNPELWDFNVGTDWKEWIDKILEKVDNEMVQNIWILGGEPLHQDRKELKELINTIKNPKIKIWIWTRNEKNKNILNEFKDSVDYIKFGKFIPNLSSIVDPFHLIKLASSNQIIVDLKKEG